VIFERKEREDRSNGRKNCQILNHGLMDYAEEAVEIHLEEKQGDR
jgi:hypothetical protein